MAGQPEFQKQLQSIEQLLGGIEAAADPQLRGSVRELVQIVMNLHREGFERILGSIRAMGESGETAIQKMSRDEMVSSLLVLYGLHPLDLEARVRQALDRVQSRLRTREGEAELLAVQDGEVRLRIRANGHGCGSSAEALKEIVEAAIFDAAPDIAALIVECADTKQSFVPLEILQGSGSAGVKAGL